MSVAPLIAPEKDQTKREPPCHMLDGQLRPLCCAERTGSRAVHTFAVCKSEGHEVCAMCSLELERRKERK